MTDTERDAVYTCLCQTMTQLGELLAPLFLARFALLAIERIGDAEVARQLVESATDALAFEPSP